MGIIGAAASVLLLVSAANTVDLTCPYGRELSLCYLGCPKSCPAPNTTSPTCTGPCSAGCLCPDGLVQFDEDICVDPTECPALNITAVVDIPAVDQCSGYGSCDECISSNAACQWCPYLPKEQSVKGSRCRDRVLNPYCPVALNDPQPSITPTADEGFNDNIQISPQRLKLKLRVGQPKQFTLQFKLSENYPLDVYFLLDVTGSFANNFKQTVIPLATDLVEALSNISSQYAVGFGTFGDKTVRPFSLPLTSDGRNPYLSVTIFGNITCANVVASGGAVEDCNPTISMRHDATIQPQIRISKLQEILANISVHLSVDKLEGGMDALMQALQCEDIIGWRNGSLRMLLYITNEQFHLAGDGKLGAAFRRNPEECNLQREEQNGKEFYQYNKDTFYDYPSVYQIRNALQSSQINVVFAVSKLPLSMYNILKRELNLGSSLQVTALEEDSTNIVRVISSSYNNISQEVRLSPNIDYPQLSFSFKPGVNCIPTADGQGCTQLSPGKTASLNVTVNLTSCLNDFTVLLRSSAFGDVELQIESLCECACTAEQVLYSPSSLQSPKNSSCSGTGTLVCGQCQCEKGMSGPQCECTGDTIPVCGPTNREECSGKKRGDCECGVCKCHIQQELLKKSNKTMAYFGEFCECDNLTSCGGSSDGGLLCLGRGTCNCITNICNCTARAPRSGLVYGGNMCECSKDTCYNAEFPNRLCVYTGTLFGTPDAGCDCGVCQCDASAMAVDGTCQPRPSVCTVNEQCARCLKNLQSSGTNCDQLRKDGCTAELYSNSTFPSMYFEQCFFKDEDSCTHTFYLSNNIEKILVEDGRDCPSDGGGLPSLAWIIPVAVIGSLVVLGALILLIVLLVVWIMDRIEYQKFKHNLEDTNWNPQENPMYVSPQQEYSNVAYKKARSRQ